MPTRIPSAIRSWNDGYAALRRRAGEARGWIELASDAPDRRWPRTTGLDAIVIASFIDAVFERTDRVTYAGTMLRWESCKAELERDVLHGQALDETYRGSRDFWQCLAMMCAHLAHVDAPLPPQAVWHRVLATIGAPLTRNASPDQDRPPVWFANAGSLNKLYLAQRTYLANLRGADRLAPEADMSGGVMPIPRSTNGDVLQLAEFWSRALEEPKAQRENGYDTVRARWTAVMRDVEALARNTDPAAVYPKNHAFWRSASSVAIHVAAALEYGLGDAQRWMASIGSSLQVASDRTKALAGAIAASVREAAADTARAAGKIVNEGARGLLGDIAAPVLIGGGVIAAILLLRTRGGEARKERAS